MKKKQIVAIVFTLALVGLITIIYQNLRYSRYSGTDAQQATQMDQEATTLARDGKYDDAIETYNDSLKKNENPMVYYNRGVAYMNKGDNENAIKDFTKAIELKGDVFAFYNNRAVVFRNLGKYKEAIPDFSKTIELKPDMAAAYYGRGFCYQQGGEKDKALKDFKKALDLGYADAKKSIDSLK